MLSRARRSLYGFAAIAAWGCTLVGSQALRATDDPEPQRTANTTEPAPVSGKFADVTTNRGTEDTNQNAGQAGGKNVGNGVAFTDFDGDGRLDLIVTTLVQSTGEPTPPGDLSEYWVGIDGAPPDDVLRSQLELPEGQGLVVNQVVADGPAAKAGLKQYDILLASGDKKLGQIGDLAAIITETKDAVLQLRLIRGGKRIIVEVKPERRPASQTGVTCPKVSKVPDEAYVGILWQDLIGQPASDVVVQQFSADKSADKRTILANKLLRQSKVATRSCAACHTSNADAYGLVNQLPQVVRLWNNNVHGWSSTMPLHYPFQQWDVTLLDTNTIYTGIQNPLPDDLEISVVHAGTKPVKIVVKKGDKSWEVSEADFREKLPPDVVEHVAAILSGRRSTQYGQFRPWIFPQHPSLDPWNDKGSLDRQVWSGLIDLGGAVIQNPEQQNAKADSTKPDSTTSTFDRIDKQFEALGSQLGELRKAMQELQQALLAEKQARDPERK